MKCIVAAVFAFTVAFTSTALAQCPPVPPTSPLTEGQIGLFYNTAGTQTCGSPAGATSLYLVARVPSGGVSQFTIPYLSQVSGPGFLVLGTEFPPGGPFIGGAAQDACANAYSPSPPTCPVAQGDLIVVAKINVLAFGGSGTACFQTYCPTLGGSIPYPPTYLSCNGSPGTFAGSLCIGVNQSPVAVEPVSWGAVKAIYR